MYKIKRPTTSIWDRLWEGFLFVMVYTLVLASAIITIVGVCVGTYKIMRLISATVQQFIC